jgi:hypothetical protein
MPDADQPAPRPVRRLALETLEPTSFGYGFISGLIAAILGIAAFGIVVALRFPAFFGIAELRLLEDFAYLRASIHLVLVASFLLGSISACLRTNKTLALVGIGFTLAAALFGGSQVAIGEGDRSATGGASSCSGVDQRVVPDVVDT